MRWPDAPHRMDAKGRALRHRNQTLTTLDTDTFASPAIQGRLRASVPRRVHLHGGVRGARARSRGRSTTTSRCASSTTGRTRRRRFAPTRRRACPCGCSRGGAAGGARCTRRGRWARARCATSRAREMKPSRSVAAKVAAWGYEVEEVVEPHPAMRAAGEPKRQRKRLRNGCLPLSRPANHRKSLGLRASNAGPLGTPAMLYPDAPAMDGGEAKRQNGENRVAGYVYGKNTANEVEFTEAK
jgi:hypothetical protein